METGFTCVPIVSERMQILQDGQSLCPFAICFDKNIRMCVLAINPKQANYFT